MTSRNIWIVVACCAASAYAEPTVTSDGTSYEIVDSMLKITVPAGKTNEVADAGLTPLVNNDVTSVEKYGLGSIVINADILAYTGDIHVKEGTWRVVDSKGLGKLSKDSLADDVGKVYVSDGATLESKCSENPKYMGKQIHVSGYGVGGNGALLVSSDVACGSSTWGSNLILEGDTFANSTAAYWCFNTAGSHKDGYITFQGHDFIVSGGTNKNPYVVFSRVNSTDLGRVVLTNNANFRFQGINNLKAVNGVTGTIVVNPGCTISGNGWNGRIEWDVLWNTEKYLLPNPYSTEDDPVTNKCSFHGGLHLNDGLKSTVATGGGLGLFGPVSGQGKIYIANEKDVPPTNLLWIANSGNTFSGELECKNVRIMLPVNGALPMTTSLRMTDCQISFKNENYTLPNAALTNAKDCVISGGQGKWTRFEKGGTGTLTYDSAVGADVFVVGDGVVRLNVDSMRAAKAGLIEGVDYYAATDLTSAIKNMETGKVATAYAIQSNLRAMTSNNLIDIRNPEGYDTDPNLRYSNITYSGYLWNRENVDKTVTFACHVGSSAYMWLDGELILSKSHVATISGVAAKKTVVLTPGHHRILTTNYAKTHDGGITWSATNFNWNAMGLRWDPQGRDATNHEYYVKMEDPGDGSLFAWALPEENVAHPLDPSTTVCGLPEFKTLRFAGSSGVLDVAEYSLAVENLEGFPAVQNGGDAFTVTKKWTLDMNDVIGGRKATALPLMFGEDAELELTNAKAAIRGMNLQQGAKWMIAESTKEILGNLSVKDSSLVRNWKVSIEDDKVYLKYVPTGTVVILR